MDNRLADRQANRQKLIGNVYGKLKVLAFAGARGMR